MSFGIIILNVIAGIVIGAVLADGNQWVGTEIIFLIFIGNIGGIIVVTAGYKPYQPQPNAALPNYESSASCCYTSWQLPP
jgi:hypothetical protein